jgi:hypothetical protein
MSASANFGDVVLLAEVGHVLVKVLDAVPMRLVGNFGHLLHVDLPCLFYVASLCRCQMVVIGMWIPFFISHLGSFNQHNVIVRVGWYVRVPLKDNHWIRYEVSCNQLKMTSDS